MWASRCPQAHASRQRWGDSSASTASTRGNAPAASRRQRASAPPAAAGDGGAAAAAAAGAAPPAPSPAQSEAVAAFNELGAATLEACSVAMAPCGPQGNGLVATAAAAPGDVLLSVPLSACLVVDYATGLRVPPGAWPRLRKGVQKDESTPWDVLQALALLDGLAGGGDAFWERYANVVLPGPEQLTLPLCFPPALLPELQHEAVASAAVAQQQRLAALFPGLSASMAPGGDGPTWLQWGFACVRSRAFRLGPDCFAFVPFLDLANHAPAQPSSDFRLSSDGGTVQLVALQELERGQEVTISYTGEEGMTNQRLMATYGFALPLNPADRLAFAALPDAQEGAGAGAGAGAATPLLSLDRMLDSLGERQAVVMGGQDPYAFAALKSLPFAAEEGGAAELGAQLALTQQLAAELAAEAAAWPTSLDQDSRLLQGWRQAAAAGSAADPRLVAAVEYRQQRKALVRTAAGLLADFTRGPA